MNTRGLILITGIPVLLILALMLIFPTPGWTQSPSPTWQNFAPTGWITATPFTVHVQVSHTAGLLPDAAYQVSVDNGVTWTDWLTQNLHTAQPLSTTLVITVSQLSAPEGDGRAQIRFRAYEAPSAAPIESPAFPLRVDTQPPTVTVLSPTANSVQETFTISGQAEDATSGVVTVSIALQDEGGRFWNGSGWQTAPIWLDATGTITWTYEGPLPAWEEGFYEVRARATDAAGHDAFSAPVTAQIDQSAPASPISPTIAPADWTNTNAFTITWSNPFDPAGIAGVWYRVGTPPTSNQDGTFVPGEGITRLEGITVPLEGEIPIFFWLEDALGHTDYRTAASVTARYDATPPLPPFGLRASPSGWQRINDFSLTWMNPDDLSGVAGVYYRFGPPPTAPDDGFFVLGEDITLLEHLQVPGEGTFDVYLWLVDKAGNADHTRANSLPDAFWYDATPPTVTARLDGPQATSGWYTGPVTISFQAEDALSGVADVQYQVNDHPWTSGTSLQLTEDGRHLLSFKAIDVAGNWTPTSTITISIDQTPPILTYTLQPEPSASGWFTQPVTLDLQAEDETSGLARVEYRVNEGAWVEWKAGDPIRLDEDGRHVVWLRAQDRAGNTAEIGPLHIPVDLTPPVTAYLVDGVPGEDPWYVSPVTVTLTPTDTASGIAVTYYRVDGGPWQQGTEFTITDDGKHEIEFYSVDTAGWVERGFPTPLWVDTTPPPAPPLVRITPSDWTNENRFRVEWATPSDLSQVVGAYYTLDTPPTAPTDGIFVANTHTITEVTVPTEGAHTLYLWLKDGAGNADHTSPAIVEEGLKYDATPPTTRAVLSGTQGDNGWWRSPVVVTLVATDTLSGPEVTLVAVDDGAYEQRPVAIVGEEGKHVVRFYSTDRAGNVEPEQSVVVRIDTKAPPLPDDLRVVTTGWQRENRFLVKWTPPLDTSGIWGVRYTVGAPPTRPDEGTFVPGEEQAVISAPGEGIFDVYMWLVDRAGNSDPNSARLFKQALWYDATPPRLDVQVEGERGESDWFIGPVTIRARATDAVSGNPTIWVAIDGSDPITLTEPLRLTEEGRHHVRIWATDAAGNTSPTWERDILIDLSPPRAWVNPMPVYMSDYRSLQGNLVTFSVSWGGTDGPNGSGIVAFDVQVREGLTGQWLTWQAQTQETTGVFVGQVGHTYFFRVRARDAAGRERPFPPAPFGDAYTHLEPVRNGDFGTGNFLYWNAARVPQREPDKSGNPVGGPGLKLTVKDADHYAGGRSLAAWLGDPEYGGAEDPGLVPIGGAVISQTITVPTLDHMRRPTLELWYRMITWDVMYAPSHQRWQDTFEVRILDAQGREIDRPLRDGYQAQNVPPIKGVDYGVKHDLGWKRFRYDLTPYAGQTIVLEISNWNRWDNKYNTYTIVEDVRVVDPSLTPHQFLPLVVGRGQRRHLPEEKAQPIIPLPVPDEGETRER